MRNHIVKNFISGLISSIEPSSLPDGAYSAVNNFITEGDKCSLRRGQLLIEDDAGAGKSRVYIAENRGTQVKFKRSGKGLYYDSNGWVEIGTDLFSTDEDNDVSFAEYHGIAGDQVWVCSPKVGPLKIMTANPGSYSDQSDTTKNYKGYIKIKQNAMFLWGRIKDISALYRSHIDIGENHTAVANENIGTGDGTTKTFATTLAFKAGGAKRTCFGISAKDASVVESFTDNYDGTLTGDAGGTGTINYMTGAISITFNTAPANLDAITCTHNWEDATSDGIADFTESATRLASEGFFYGIRQDAGGELMNVLTYKNIEYCIHKHNIWAVTLPADDTTYTNTLFRKNIGIPHWRGAVPTGEGIYMVDDSDEKDPKIRLLTYEQGSTEVIPISISDAIDLTDYRFNLACLFQFGEYILIACRHKDHDYNDTVFLYHRAGIAKGAWDKLDYTALNFGIYDGALWSGDSLTDNVYELFSGTDDDDSKILNHLILNLTDLDFDGLKKTKQLVISGNIGPDQEMTVSGAFDNAPFVELGTILGSGSYVDTGTSVAVGARTLGRDEAGGGGADITAYNYVKKIKLQQDKFKEVKLKFEATEIGWADISEITYKDIRIKSRKLPTKYR